MGPNILDFFFIHNDNWIDNLLIGHISYEIKNVRFSQLLIFEKNGLVWPADICQPIFFKYQKLRKYKFFYCVADVAIYLQKYLDNKSQIMMLAVNFRPILCFVKCKEDKLCQVLTIFSKTWFSQRKTWMKSLQKTIKWLMELRIILTSIIIKTLLFYGIYKLHTFCMSRIQLFSSNLKVVVFRVCKKSFMSSIRIFFSAK